MSPILVRSAPLGLALLLCAFGAGAQMYKWTDAKGVVHYSDQPPAAKGAKVETKALPSGARQVELPYTLAEAVRRNPVVLYTTSDCGACDDGRALLTQRGIPFAEKTVKSNDDQQKLKEAGSDGQLPLLTVGRDKRVGFEATAWNEALNNAAYPKQKMLPRNYQYPAAVSAAPPRPLARNEAPDREPDAAAKPKAPPPPDETAPPGFRF
jgi:glutaredoxin